MTTRTIRKLLIANRGEIARRIQRTCRSLGVDHVAVYSDADAEMPFVTESDEAVHIGAPEAAKSYLNIDAVLDAAQRTGADAIHPGYGFLSENAAFARRVAEAGLIFVGPTPEAIDAMGTKREAKELVEKAGVPVVPGYDGRDPSEQAFKDAAQKIGYPVLLKASAGGGGKGMRRVNDEAELGEALKAARREATKAFGDDTMLLEKYVLHPRHIEVQILGDQRGRVVHLGERECSVQRRHQKVIEECPAPNLSDELRARLCEAAVRVGETIGYQNAGTVEFIVGGEEFFFLEVNTRLQVEHPVTERVYGVDLVELQLRVAEGQKLPESLPPASGHAIEARLYAEDDAYLPQTGTILDWDFEASDRIRVDAGVEAGSIVGVHYDPMLAKVVGSGSTREQARRNLCAALRRASVLGVTTNREMLIAILEHPEFVQGKVTTHFLQTATLSSRSTGHAAHALIAAVMEERDRVWRKRSNLPHLNPGFSNVPRFEPDESWTVEGLGDDRPVACRAERDGRTTVRVGETSYRARLLGRGSSGEVRIDVDGHQFSARVRWNADRAYVATLGETHVCARAPRFPKVETQAVEGALLSPMPGKIVAVEVAEGDAVSEGQRLVVLEAMKMEHSVRAPHEGKVAELRVASGDQVEGETLLLRIER